MWCRCACAAMSSMGRLCETWKRRSPSEVSRLIIRPCIVGLSRCCRFFKKRRGAADARWSKAGMSMRRISRSKGVLVSSGGPVDQHGAVLDVLEENRRDTHEAKRLMRKLLRKDGPMTCVLITDRLASYRIHASLRGVRGCDRKFDAGACCCITLDSLCSITSIERCLDLAAATKVLPMSLNVYFQATIIAYYQIFCEN
jgi:hypothetical protein